MIPICLAYNVEKQCSLDIFCLKLNKELKKIWILVSILHFVTKKANASLIVYTEVGTDKNSIVNSRLQNKCAAHE